MTAEDKSERPWWVKVTSAALTVYLAGCALEKKFGYVSPAPEGSKTPTSDPAYCDTHILTINPEQAPSLSFANMNIIVEQPMGPSGVGQVKDLIRVKNPNPIFIDNVRRSVKNKLDIDPNSATILQFGMEGKKGNDCTPFVMILDKVQPNGEQRSFVAFSQVEADTNGDGRADTKVLVPPFDGKADKFLEMGQVQDNNGTVRIGPVDNLDPNAIWPIFTVDTKTGIVEFYPPFSDAKNSSAPILLKEASFVEASFRIGKKIATPTAQSTLTVPADGDKTIDATATKTAMTTQTPDISKFMEVQPTTQFRTSEINNYPFISIEDATSAAFDAWLDQLESEGKLGDFSKYAEPFLPRWGNPTPSYETNGRPGIAKPLTIINIPVKKNGAYTLTDTRPFYNEAFFRTNYDGKDYVVWVQRWKNIDGTTGRIKYMYSFEKIRSMPPNVLNYYGLGGDNNNSALSPVLFNKKNSFSNKFLDDKNYYDSYWKVNGSFMLQLARDIANRDPQGINSSDFSKFIWSPGTMITNWMGPAF